MMLEIALGCLSTMDERPDIWRVRQAINRARSVISPIMEGYAGTVVKLIASLTAATLVLSADTTQDLGAKP